MAPLGGVVKSENCFLGEKHVLLARDSFSTDGAFDAVERPWADKMKPHRHVVVENIGDGGSSLSVNGAGKPILLRSIMGLDEHDQHISRRIKG